MPHSHMLTNFTPKEVIMYVNVHVRVFDHEKLVELFRSVLVKEFHPKTGILYENEVLKLKLFFEKDPAQESIYAFCECGNIIYLEYNYSEDITKKNAAQFKTTAGNNAPSANITTENAAQFKTTASSNTPSADQIEEKISADEEGKVPKKKYVPKERAVNIPEFEEIAKTSNSKSDFLNGIMSFLEVPSELQNAFLQIIGIYPSLEKVTWENILAALQTKEVDFNSYHRRVLCELATKKLNLRFINVIASIVRILSEHEAGINPQSQKNVDDSKNQPEELVAGCENQPEEPVAGCENQPEEPVAGDENQPENPAAEDVKQETEREVLLNCMPKLSESAHIQDINAIEDVLRELKEDTESSFYVKIVKVIMILTGKCMPTAYTKDEMNKLIAFTSNALETLQNEVHCYLKPETITEDKLEQNFFRMQILKWSTIANNLAKLYDPSFDGKITARDFLSDLKEFLQ